MNSNSKNIGRFVTWMAFIVVLLILPFFTFLVFKNKLSKASFWWPILNIKIESLLGSKLKCEKVYWCSNLEFCAEQCQTEDGVTYAKFFSISLPERTVTAKNWGLNSIPKKLSSKTSFPKIPIAIKKMQLDKGDLTAIHNEIPKINVINLTRSGIQGQVWKIHGIVNDRKIKIKGITGDVSNIDIEINNYPFKLKNNDLDLQLKVNGDFKITNKSFKQKPVNLQLRNIKLEDILVNKISTSNTSINGDIQFDKSLTKIIDIKNLDIKSNFFHIHSDPEKRVQIFNLYRTVNLIIEPIQLNKLNPYLVLVPKQNGIELKALSGVLDGEINLNITNTKDTKTLINFDSLRATIKHEQKESIEIGPAQGSLNLKGKEVKELKANVQNQSLAVFNGFIEKNIEINNGFLSGDLQIEDGKDFIGNIEVADLSANYNDQINQPEKLSISGGNGKFQLSKKNINGDFLFNFQNKKRNKVFLKTSLKLPNNLSSNNFYKELRGSVNISSPNLEIDEIKINEPETSFKGILTKLDTTFNLKNNNLKLTEFQTKTDNFIVNSPLLQTKSLNIQKGEISLDSQKQITMNDLFIALSEHEKIEIDGKLKVNSEIDKGINLEDIVAKDIEINANASLETILDFIGSIQGEEPRDWMNKIDNPTGFVTSKLKIKNSELLDTQINFRGVGIDYEGSKIRKGHGQIRVTESHNFHVNDLSLNFGSKSSLVLDGYFRPNKQFFKLGSTEEFIKSLASFKGKVKGQVNLGDFVSEKLQKKMYISLSEGSTVPVDAEIYPGQNQTIQVSLKSNFDNLGKLNSDWVDPTHINTGGYLIAEANINPENGYFNISDLECSVQGLNIIAKANGYPTDFKFKVFTDPILDLGKLFKSVKGAPIRGGLIGWIANEKVNIFEKATFWENLQFSLRTDDLQSIEVGPIELRSLESYFAAKGGKGYATLVVDNGTVKNLGFSDLNVSFLLNNNDLQMPGLTFKTAGGETNIQGQVNLLTAEGSFTGEAENVEVGEIARGLSNMRGLSGTGNFTFVLDGHLWSLIKGEKPVFGSGSFDLKNGNTSAVLDLQKKLNLANLVFNGPLALNMNSLLEVLSPTSSGYYRLLSGEWEVDKDYITITNGKFRGTNKLSLNTAGLYSRKSNHMDFNFVGSIPRIPVRTGKSSSVSNAFSQLNVANILGHAPILKRIFDIRPRVFKFRMRGEADNQAELNGSSSNSFQWLDSGLYSNLPMPALPENN